MTKKKTEKSYPVVYFKVTWSHGFTHQYPILASPRAIESEEERLSNMRHVAKFEYSEKKFPKVKGV